MNKLEFYAFTLWNYPYIPSEDDMETFWINLPNKYYDPQIGYRHLKDYLDVFKLYEEYGFDGIVVNEHHATPGATTPSPNLNAALLIAKTERIPIAIIGNMLTAHLSPIRVAEEVAYLDIVSGGRVICGFVRGTGMEYFSHPVDPSSARDKFWEAHDLILKAWTHHEPFAWNGVHYHVPTVNPWPRPLQQPHPEIWIPGVGSLDTIDIVAKHRHRYMTVFAPKFFVKQQYSLFRRTAEEKYGYQVKPNQLLASLPIHVAETDEIAHQEARAQMMWLYHRHLRVPPHLFFPPGFMEKRSFRHMVEARVKYNLKDFTQLTYEDILEQGYAIVGSPQTVVEKLAEFCEDVGAGGVIGAASPFGPAPKWMTMKAMQIFAEEVMPHFRTDGRPVWANRDRPAPHTVSEFAHLRKEPAYPPRIRMAPGEEPVDPRRAHIIERSRKPTKTAAE